MSAGEDERGLCVGWLAAVERAEVRGALESVYERASAEIAARGPACWASGRCCNFEKAGHRLYVTGLEAAYVVRGVRIGREAGAGPRGAGEVGVQDGSDAGPRSRFGLVVRPALPPAAGGCPFQVGNVCSVHSIKPVGCRVYFCDRSARVWQEELSESLLAEVRGIHERYGVEYRYVEWRAVLGWFGEGEGNEASRHQGIEGGKG